MAVACGSLGVLTSVPARGIVESIERFRRGDWVPRVLPALDVAREIEPDLFALNDIAIVRSGTGQVRITARVDDEIFARLAGDGCVVSTPIGSSAYGLAAGGPLLTPDLEGLVFTRLPTHGGTIPPAVLGPRSTLHLEVRTGQSQARIEVDGQVRGDVSGSLAITYRAAVATLVTLAGQPSTLSVLRDRRIISDSPRLLAEDMQTDAGEAASPS
jgi:NAD+ kinase